MSRYEITRAFADLRSQVLGLKPEIVGLPGSGGTAIVAVLMETGYPEAIVTLVAVADGSASLYFSNGGGIIGSGQQEDVSRASMELVSSSDQFLPQASRTTEFPLPAMGSVRFYLVTEGGVYTLEAGEDDLGYGRHPWSALFHKGHELITAIRTHASQ